MNPTFIPSKLGSKLGHRGLLKVYTANPECVDWRGSAPVHPDELQTINYGNQPCKLVRREAFQRESNSWNTTRLIDGHLRDVRITLHERIEHTLTFVAPNGMVIDYRTSIPVDGQLETFEVLST